MVIVNFMNLIFIFRQTKKLGLQLNCRLVFHYSLNDWKICCFNQVLLLYPAFFVPLSSGFDPYALNTGCLDGSGTDALGVSIHVSHRPNTFGSHTDHDPSSRRQFLGPDTARCGSDHRGSWHCVYVLQVSQL